MDDKDIKQILSGFSNAFKKEDIELFEKLSEGIDFSRITDGDSFQIFLNHKTRKFLRWVATQKFGNNDNISFMLLNYSFLEGHFKSMIQKCEGFGCSADKSHKIMKAILNFYQTGAKIAWNYKGEVTYNLPMKVFKTHEEIISFFEALYRLWLGMPDLYLKHLQNYLYLNPKDNE